MKCLPAYSEPIWAKKTRKVGAITEREHDAYSVGHRQGIINESEHYLSLLPEGAFRRYNKTPDEELYKVLGSSPT